MKTTCILTTLVIITGFIAYKFLHCQHNQLSRPFFVDASSSLPDQLAFAKTKHFAVCKKCNRKIEFDWDNQKQMNKVEPESKWFEHLR